MLQKDADVLFMTKPTTSCISVHPDYPKQSRRGGFSKRSAGLQASFKKMLPEIMRTAIHDMGVSQNKGTPI